MLTCHKASVEAGRQLVAIPSLSTPCGCQDQTEVVRLGVNCLHPLGHLTSSPSSILVRRQMRISFLEIVLVRALERIKVSASGKWKWIVVSVWNGTLSSSFKWPSTRPKRVLDPLEAELQLWALTWVRSEARSVARAARTLNHGAVSPAQLLCFVFYITFLLILSISFS